MVLKLIKLIFKFWRMFCLYMQSLRDARPIVDAEFPILMFFKLPFKPIRSIDLVVIECLHYVSSETVKYSRCLHCVSILHESATAAAALILALMLITP